MQKKILIIGLGKMGMSHLKSFINKNVLIYIFDKNKDIKKKVNKNLYKNIIFLNSLSELEDNINFCIISTESIPRYKILTYLIENKRIKKFLLEKFIFNKEHQFLDLIKNKNLKNKIYINLWGKFLFDNLKKILPLRFSNINIFINKGHLLSNLTHFINFLFYFKLNLKIKNNNLIYYNIKNSNYHEAKGLLNLSSGKKNVKIKTKKIDDIFLIDIFDRKNHGSIILKKNLKIYFYKNKKRIKVLDFPLAFKQTHSIYRSKKKIVPKLNDVIAETLFIYKLLKQKSKRQINIR